VCKGINRFFRAAAMAGRLHLSDIGDHGPWDSSRIVYADEQELDLILQRMMVVRKVQTVDLRRVYGSRFGGIIRDR
jgi:hypothetical protein